MEKSRSYDYSASYSGGEFGFEDRANSYNFNGPSGKTDPDRSRKKRVASYNVFTKEEKVKTSVRNSFKWIKTKFSEIRYGV
ncbi:hypothetical protein Syun_013742 [Stephania yunnanensis]|uniref:Uncharacterized protein n=1 Tax=Stephania yunnanensis TaxID=152371 RepID=A0AAP0JI61_9MAGN